MCKMQKELVATVTPDKMSNKEKMIIFGVMLAIAAITVFLIVNPAFAATNYVTRIRQIMNNMVTIVGVIFQAVGAILSIYAVGQLILAFKNEDANSKSSASTLLVVGIVLIAVPGIITTLGLVNLIGA